MNKDFFISYNGSDLSWAEWIAWILEEKGYTVDIQAWDFRPGEDFVLKMHEAAIGTSQTIAVLSDNYLQAKYTQSEWAAAFVQDPTGSDRKLIFIRVAQCKLDGLLPSRIHIDLVGLAETEAQSAILAGVSKERPKPPKRPPFPGNSNRVTTSPVEYPGELKKNLDLT